MHLTFTGSGGGWPKFDRLTELHLDWEAVHAISLNHSLESILEQNKEIFQQGLGIIKGIEAKLHVNTQTKPLYFKACSVPFTLKQKVEQELREVRESRCHHTYTIFRVGYICSRRGQE